MKEFPILKTEHCVLSQISDDDITEFVKIFDDEETIRFLPELYELVSEENGPLLILSSFNVYLSADEGMLWGIRQLGTLIGFVAFMDLSSNPTIIYAMHPNYRRRGYMKESIDAAVRFVFENFSCDYIQTEVYRDNNATVHLLEDAGFVKLGEDSQKLFFKLERYDE